jgi:hypothetical protein
MPTKPTAAIFAALALTSACSKHDDADATARAAGASARGSAAAASATARPSGSAATGEASGALLAGIGQVALGARRDCGRKDDGSVWCWGADGAAKHAAMDESKQIAVVDAFVCAISPKGHIACTESETGRVIPISLYRDGVVLVGGPTGYCVRTEDGVLRCGLEDLEKHEVKAPSGLPGLKNPSAFSLGATVGCAVLDGEVWCWNNEKGAGLPRTLKALKGAVSVAVGRLRGCASTTEGELYCFRADRDAEPHKLDGWKDLTQLAMAFDAEHPDRLCALTRNGAVVCGALRGEGDAIEIEAPKAIEGVTDAAELGVGAAGHSCARTKAGNVWCWGVEQTRATAVRVSSATP